MSFAQDKIIIQAASHSAGVVFLTDTSATWQLRPRGFYRHQTVHSFLGGLTRSMIQNQISFWAVIQTFHPDVPALLLKHNCFPGFQYLYLFCFGKLRQIFRRVSVRNEHPLHFIGLQKFPNLLQIFRMQFFQEQLVMTAFSSLKSSPA